MSAPTGVVRVRIEDGFASLAIKGVTKGISRREFEYEIPIEDAEQLLAGMCANVIEKKRYLYPLDGGLVAEVDVFPQIDLCVAEVELPRRKPTLRSRSGLLKKSAMIRSTSITT